MPSARDAAAVMPIAPEVAPAIVATRQDPAVVNWRTNPAKLARSSAG
jgi:hypothetical protein